ncbi:MAG: hypothetical protein WBA54_06600 [Acidaminobacteraceae bacterium]
MITITPAKESDIKDILSKYDYILSENLTELKYENTMILVEGGNIYGVSSYTTTGEIAKINVLYIDDDKRRLKFGDSLIKATLNLIDKRDIKRAYIVMSYMFEDFLKSSSLIKSSEEEYINDLASISSDNNLINEKEIIYHADLPEFFNTACRSTHKH